MEQSYAIAPSLDAVLRRPDPGLGLQEFRAPLVGPRRRCRLGCLAAGRWPAAFRHPRQPAQGQRFAGKGGVALSHCYLVYGESVYIIDSLNPGEPVTIGPETKRVTLETFFSDEASGGPALPGVNQIAYDRSSREMDYVLQSMLFYNAAGGRKRTHLTNASQGFTDLSGLVKPGGAVLVAMPPQDGSCRGGDLLRGPPTRQRPWATTWTSTRRSTASCCPSRRGDADN